MTFSEYAENWRTRQRHVVDYSTGRRYRSHLTTHLYPELGDYRIEATSPLTIERFITGMERRNVKPGTLHNVYGLLRTVPPDAVRKGAINSDPTLGIKTRPYIPPRSVIPTVEYTTAATRKADAQLGLVVTMMRGCGLRNVEARAVNINNVISDDIYRVSDQIHHNTYRPAPLKHRHPGEFRDVPLPRSVRETIERIEQRHGTTDEGYLLRGPNGYFTYGIESTRAATLHATLPPPKGNDPLRLPRPVRLRLPRTRNPHHRRLRMARTPQHRNDLPQLPAPHARINRTGRKRPGPHPRHLNPAAIPNPSTQTRQPPHRRNTGGMHIQARSCPPRSRQRRPEPLRHSHRHPRQRALTHRQESQHEVSRKTAAPAHT
ncbi:hypothetical protein [Streptomyces sp. C10]|uniref:hypothetical protein n=1 Tax=Streptomyces sp. C10 TaxID=531941 RepID=UPI00397EECED